MKFLTYYRLSILTAIIFLLLAIMLMFAPDQLLSGWGVEFTTGAGLVARRASAFYTSIAVMFFMARNAEPSIARTALIYGIITVCMILVILGLYELIAGHATRGILAAIFTEVMLSILFMAVCCSGDKSINRSSHANDGR